MNTVFPTISPEYVIVRHIDSGGQADVFEVRHTLGGRLAARVLREAWDPLARVDFQKCIERQLRAAGPRVARVLAYDADAPKPFMVMDFMPEGSLADELVRRAGQIPAKEALSIAESLAAALADAHARGIAHCDFKPGNVLKSPAGTWVLSDFGSAVTVDSRQVLRAPRWVGTPAYAAPEQLRGQVTQASDVYALGVVLYEMLTGATALAPGQVVARHGHRAAGVAELLAKLTAAEPRLRPTAREAVLLLQQAGPQFAPATNVAAWIAPSTAQVVRGAAAKSEGSGLLTFLGAAGVALAGAAVVNRFSKSWDPSVARYRGSGGKFRGGGLFD